MKLFKKGEGSEKQGLEDALLRNAGIDPDMKRNVDAHNLEAKKQAKALLPKLKGLYKLLDKSLNGPSITAGVGLEYGDKKKLRDYLEKNLKGVIDPEVFMGNSHDVAMMLVLEAMEGLSNTIKGSPQEVGSETRESVLKIVKPAA